jgi:hypothetical protein
MLSQGRRCKPVSISLYGSGLMTSDVCRLTLVFSTVLLFVAYHTYCRAGAAISLGNSAEEDTPLCIRDVGRFK